MKSNTLLSTSPIISPTKTPRKSPKRSIKETRLPISSPSSPTSNTLKPKYKDANAKPVEEFIPEPPLENQFKNLGRTFGKIKDFFNVEEKDNVSSSSNSSSLNEGSSIASDALKDGSKENNQFDIEVGITTFSDSLNKIINDISQMYSTASMMKQNSVLAPNSEAQNYFDSSASKVDEQLKNIDALFESIFDLQYSIMTTAVKAIQKPKILLGPLFKKLNSSIGNCHKNYINSVWDMAKISLDDNDMDVYELNFRPTLINHLISTIKSLNKLNAGIFISISEIEYDPQIAEQTKNEESPRKTGNDEEGEELLNIDDKTNELKKNACNLYGIIINNFVVQDLSIISPIIKEFWTIDPKTKKITENEADTANNKEANDDDDNDDEGVKLVSSIYSTRCDSLNEMYTFLSKLKPKQVYVTEEEQEEEEESEDDLDEDEEAEKYPLIHLIKGQLTKLSTNYLEEVKTLWLLSTPSKFNRVQCVPEFGLLLVNLLKIRVYYNDLSLKITTVSSLFRISVRINDDSTTTELIKILDRLFNYRFSYLSNIRMNEIYFISSTVPQFVSQFNDISEDEDTANEIKQTLTQIYNKKAEKIKATSTQISDSLFVCQKTIFQYHRYITSKQQKESQTKEKPKQDENQTNEEEEVNEEDDQLEVFSKLDVNFNEITHEYLANLKNYLNDIYANVLITSSSQSRDNYDGYSVSAVSAISTVSTASAKKARKNAKSKATRKKIESKLNYSERLQVIFTEESLARTYEEMFSSLQSLITAAIRNLDADMAEKMNKELRKLNMDHLGNLEEIRKLYVEELDIKATKQAEERMTNSQTVSNRIILKCLEESFKDVIEQTVDNYQSNLNEIEEDFKAQKEISNQEFSKRFDELTGTEHENAVLLEKNRKIKLTQEEQRQVSAMNEREKLIKKLLNERRYDEAEREKKILDAEKVKEKEARKKALEARYDKIRNQKSNVHNRNLKILEESRVAKKMRRAQEKQNKIDELKKTLASSLRGMHQRFLLFGTRLMQNDSKIRKDLSVKFDKIIQNSMKEHEMSDILRPKQKTFQ